MDKVQEFVEERSRRIENAGANQSLLQEAGKFMLETLKSGYSYNFDYLGRPIIQYPQDMVAMQELIWQVKPDLIIETGIAHGGSLIFSASMLALLDYCDAAATGQVLEPANPKRRVLGIDIDIRPHNRTAIEHHPMASRISMIQGSSIAAETIKQVWDFARDYKRILISLDSNHTHDHVLAELEAYAPLTSKGSYCVVFDTVIEDMPEHSFPDRPWDKGNNPKTAVWRYLETLQHEGRLARDGESLQMTSDMAIDRKLLISVAPQGYLLRV